MDQAVRAMLTFSLQVLAAESYFSAHLSAIRLAAGQIAALSNIPLTYDAERWATAIVAACEQDADLADRVLDRLLQPDVGLAWRIATGRIRVVDFSSLAPPPPAPVSQQPQPQH